MIFQRSFGFNIYTMLINIPKSNDYQNVGIECLVQAYKNIFAVDNGQLIPEASREDIWKYHEIVLRTSIVLIHQGIESLLKAGVSKKTPLLLIDQKRGDWKTLPNSADESFIDLYTIAGNDLLKTFFACVLHKSISDDFITHFENVRIKRNKIVHGIGGDEISPEEVLKLILWTFTYLLGEDSFWTSFKEKFFKHPGHEVGDIDLENEEVQQYNHLDYLEAILGKGELNNHFKIDLKARRYFCPYCTRKDGVLVEGDGTVVEHLTSKWAFLNPNTPESTLIQCLVCDESFEVERKDCNSIKRNACKGNLMYLDEEDEVDEEKEGTSENDTYICLTCMETQMTQ